MVATSVERRVQIIFEVLVGNAERNMRKLSKSVAGNIQKWKQNAELLDRNTRKYVNTAARLDDIVKRSQVMGRWTESYQKEMGKTTEVVTQRMIRLNNLTKRQIEFLKKQGFEVKDVTAAIGKKGQLLKRNYAATIAYDTSMRRLTRAHERFKMEMLSVLFFGMSLSRMFRGYIDNVLKMTGVTDMLTLAMQSLLFPVLLPMIPILYEITEKIMGLDKGWRALLGAGMILVTLFGMLLWTIGTFVLGIDGLLIALSKLGVTLPGIGAILGKVSGIFSATFGLIFTIALAVIIGIIKAFDEFKASVIWIGEAIYNIIKGDVEMTIGFFKAAFGLMHGLLTGNFDLFFNGVKTFITGVKDFVIGGLLGLVRGIIALLGSIALGLLRFLGDVVNMIIDFIDWILGGPYVRNFAEGIVSFVQDICDKIVGIIKGLIRFIENAVRSIGGGLGSVVPKGELIPGFRLFQEGGVVPGPVGRPVPAIVHGGETVLPHGVSPVNISINVESPTLSSRLDMSDLADEISLSLTRELRRLGFI